MRPDATAGQVRAAVKQDKLAWIAGQLKDVEEDILAGSSRRLRALVRSLSGRKGPRRWRAAALRTADNADPVAWVSWPKWPWPPSPAAFRTLGDLAAWLR